jgi:hypothetical protein
MAPFSAWGWRMAMAQPLRLGRAEEQIVEARRRLEEQKAKLNTLIVKGAPTQAAEDLLCKLHEALKRLTRHARSSG